MNGDDREAYGGRVIRDERLRAIRDANDLPVATILRLAFVAAAEERSRRTRRRPLRADELRRVIEHYRGE